VVRVTGHPIYLLTKLSEKVTIADIMTNIPCGGSPPDRGQERSWLPAILRHHRLFLAGGPSIERCGFFPVMGDSSKK
jgi:hypothetical protein